MNTKLQAICDSQRRPLNLFVTAGQVSVYIGARSLPSSRANVDWFREALKDKEIRACIPRRKQRKATVRYNK